MIAVIAALCVGYIIGVLQHGVKVDINQKLPEPPTEYNESVVENLDDEVRLYSESYGRINERV